MHYLLGTVINWALALQNQDKCICVSLKMKIGNYSFLQYDFKKCGQNLAPSNVAKSTSSTTGTAFFLVQRMSDTLEFQFWN